MCEDMSTCAIPWWLVVEDCQCLHGVAYQHSLSCFVSELERVVFGRQCLGHSDQHQSLEVG